MDTIKLNRDAKTEASSVNLFYPYRGAPLRDLCIKEGFITGEEEAIGFRTGTVLKMPQITPAQLLALQQTFQFYIRLPNFSLPVVRWLEKALEQKKPLADPLFKFMVLFYKAWTLNRYGWNLIHEQIYLQAPVGPFRGQQSERWRDNVL